MNDVLKDHNNKWSFSRVTSAILILAYLIAMFYILFTEHKLVDIPVQLAGLIAVIYGVNRFSQKNINGGEL